ncbi:hypothetical protein HDU83_005760 [Entophlyctis luteolus]|nr:hypothetical protein HDU82_003670 [Entophlyctis luteolus]KAJ3354154.1 hypothetical protein HDU83_005760 [Entophlyctis luteolus]KAJ3392671.1 hypothetical protein HDU84_003677 [Entophlyctis sp. JEL0112]
MSAALYEAALHGSIPAAKVPALLERLAGLTGAAPLLSATRSVNAFAEHELVCVADGMPLAGAAGSLRLRSDCRSGDEMPARKWSVLFIAAPQPPRPGQLASVRAVYASKVVRGNVLDYLDLLGFK